MVLKEAILVGIGLRSGMDGVRSNMMRCKTMSLNIRDDEQLTQSPALPVAPPAGERARRTVGRRSFLRRGMAAAGTVAAGATLLGAQRDARAGGLNGRLGRGDAAILRFLAAAEIIESDLWQQYNELAGIQDNEVPGGTGNPAFTAAIVVLDADMSTYIHDNTNDEFSHANFINAYLAAHGAETVSLDAFRILPSSQATGAQQIGRITNLMQLTIDTSWWGRYRDSNHNPDLNPGFMFPQAVPGLLNGQFPAIPRTDADLANGVHLQAIANTAGFHFATIEVGGSSLYPALAQRVTHPEVLKILLSIGPVETSHFQTWHDKAGNAPMLTDPTNGLMFPDLTNAGEALKANLIMPEPCPFLSPALPRCSIIRPTETRGAAMAALKGLVAQGLFLGQPPAFFQFVGNLAAEADEARRGDF
jgi:hypothetical protein